MGSITTKIGDKGNTKLWSGEDVRKTNLAIEFCGSIDELVSTLGVCYAILLEEDKCFCYSYILYNIEKIQKLLFTVASEVATKEPKRSTLENKVDKNWVDDIETEIYNIEKIYQQPKGWVLPGSSCLSANLDVARCVARRCERDYVKVMDNCLVDNKEALVWLNRLSDLLYLLARLSENNNYRMVK